MALKVLVTDICKKERTSLFQKPCRLPHGSLRIPGYIKGTLREDGIKTAVVKGAVKKITLDDMVRIVIWRYINSNSIKSHFP